MKANDQQLRIALAGNPNSGKTTLFNALTGGNQYVGNWPGVTVEKKEGYVKGKDHIIIQDLPGIYSLSPYTEEEVISRNYLIEDQPDVILNIVDGTNLERNLYLTTQLTELNIPVVIAINMIDQVGKNGDKINFPALESKLGCPVLGISALKKTGLQEVVDACALRAANISFQKPIVSFPSLISATLDKIQQTYLAAVPDNLKYWYALKIFERDNKILNAVPLSAADREQIEHIIAAVEKEYDDDTESMIVNERYQSITDILENTYQRQKIIETTSDKIDKVITNRWLALPIFAGVMCLMYFIAISGVGVFMTDWVNEVLFEEWIMGGASDLLTSMEASEWLQSLIVDGILAGIGAPIGFLPQMAMVFLFLGFLQDCGYMARVAFIMDRIFRRFGLSGKSFLSFLVSAGCGVPGIMATRTIENTRDRDMTMITTTAIPCSAKLPVIALVAGYVIDGAWWVAPAVYFASIFVVIVSCVILKKFQLFAGEPAPFVMELPAYHWPTVRGVANHAWTRVAAFLKKAGSIIFAMCVLMWFLASFGFAEEGFGLVAEDQSLLAVIGGAIAWIFVPLGFGTWQAVSATFAGFTAKEAVVSTMGILAGLGSIEEYSPSMYSAFHAFFPTDIAAISFLFFSLFNSPCLAAVATLYREISSKKHFWFALIFQNLGAYCIALLVYQIGGLLLGQVPFTGATVVAFAVLLLILYLLFRPAKVKREITQHISYQRI